MHLVMAGDDGSQTAAGAVDWAARFAAERGAQLVVVRVAGAGQDAPSADPIEGVTIVEEDHPASGIMMAAHDHDADLVVLGRRGGGGFPSLPIGTTAHHVSAACGRPVVVVPPTTLPDAQPLVTRVVVGLDGLPGSLEAAAWAIRHFSDAHFTVVHALDLAPAFSLAEDDPGEMYDRARLRVGALIQDQWTRPFVDAGVSFDVLVDEGGPAELLLEAATRRDADLVVVGRREHFPMRGTLGGVSQRVLAYAPCAAAIVPFPAGED
jgi:nucleotide-binding universal stress UspA family protein